MAYWTSVLIILVSAICFADEVLLEWDPNSEPDLAGYCMYIRQEGEIYDYDFPVWQGDQNICKIDNLNPIVSYFFVVRAYDLDGNESGNSNEVYLPSRTGNSGGGGGCFIISLF